MNDTFFNLLVLGGGPAGQKAAVQGAKAGARVLLIDEGHSVGGECVRRGTIPSKTLRETAVALTGFRQRSGGVIDVQLREDLELESLMKRMHQVIEAHERYLGEQLARNGVTVWHGRARFESPRDVLVSSVDGTTRRASAPATVIATGSRPRTPPNIDIDHEHVFDSDSLLSMPYLPRSLTVLGGGIIGSEYASIFAALGVEVHLVDKRDAPVAFLDSEITSRFRAGFERNGGRFLGGRDVVRVEWDGLASVVTELDDGEELRSEKLLVALGRVPNLDRLELAAARLRPTNRGMLAVDENCRTDTEGIYAVGDVIGPPALAASAMEQGRRAARHALGLPVSAARELIPVGVYTVPEMSSVGLDEAAARERYHGAALVGRARFEETARGHISAIDDGMLKLVADPTGREIVGVQIVGEGAAELVHIGQMALLGGMGVDALVENIFNFPTLAEAYRVAALDIVGQRASLAARRQRRPEPVLERAAGP